MAEETEKPIPMRLGDLLTAWKVEAQAAHEAYESGQARGPVTGLGKLDTELGGFLSPGLHVLHGTPGAGKTAFALQVAATCGCPALFVTCEMPPLELLRRVAARVTNTFLGRFKSGELAPAEAMELARRAVAEAPDLWLLDATTRPVDHRAVEDIAATARGDGRHVLVVVDSVHAWAHDALAGQPEYEAVNTILTHLKAMAAALSCPVLAVAERNRQSMERGGMNASAGSRRFEYTGESVLALHRATDDKGNELPEDSAGEVAVMLKLPKNRNNRPHGKVELRFHGAIQRFRVSE